MRTLRQRLATMLVLALPLSTVAVLAPATAQAVAYPSITITAPANNASVAGTTAITFNAALDPAGTATITSFQLVVDNAPYGGTLGCNGGPAKSCSQQLLWEATGTGSHALKVRMTTSANGTTDSAAVTVTVTHPLATVTISSPTAAATVSGPVQIDTDGAFDNPSAGDQVDTMYLLVDGAVSDYETCSVWTQSTTDCPVSFFWDSTLVAPGSHTLTTRLTTRSGGVWDSASVPVTVSPYDPPTVTVSAGPAPGSTVQQGPVTVTATGVVHATSDAAQQLLLLVDGQVKDFATCTGTPVTCTATLTWDAHAATGTHSVSVEFDTDFDYVLSSPVTVTVAGSGTGTGLPASWAYFVTGPAANPVYGRVTLTADGRIDPHSLLTAVDMQLFVDDVPSGPPAICVPTSPHVCSVAVPWDTRGLAGKHVVKMRFDTTSGFVWTETQTYDIEPYAAGQTSIRVSAWGGDGHEVVSGLAWRGSSSLGNAPVTVTVTPAIGAPRTYQAMTDQSGLFSLALGKRFSVTSTVTATLPADFGGASSSYVQEAYVTLTCKLPKKVIHGKATTVTCATSPAAQDGGKVTLYFKYPHAGYHVLGHGLLKHGKATITFTTKVKNYTVQLWARLSRTKTAAPSYTRTILSRFV